MQIKNTCCVKYICENKSSIFIKHSYDFANGFSIDIFMYISFKKDLGIKI